MVVSLKLLQPSIQKQKVNLANAEIILVDGDKEIVIGINDICSDAGENFSAVLDTATTDAVEQNYTGIQLKDILNKYNINFSDKKLITLSAVDGYSVAYSIEEVLIDKNVYITYKQDGIFLRSRDEGGRGPYESIVVSDNFSNRRCKWLTKIEVN
jgi:hypothetical protein